MRKWRECWPHGSFSRTCRCYDMAFNRWGVVMKMWSKMGSYQYLSQHAVGGNHLKNHCAFQCINYWCGISLSQQVFSRGETCLIWKHMASHSVSSIKVNAEKYGLKLSNTQKIHRYWRDSWKQKWPVFRVNGKSWVISVVFNEYSSKL